MIDRRTIVIAMAAVACAPGTSVAEGGDDTGHREDTSPFEPTTSSDPTASTSDDDTAGGSTGIADDDAAAFVLRPDWGGGGPLCGSGDRDGVFAVTYECDQFAQDCPAGEKCTPWANDGGTAWNANACVPIAREPAQLHEPCHKDGSATSPCEDCDLGLMCMFVDRETLQGVCVAQCTGDPSDPTCPDPTVCMFDYNGAISLCLPPCDPLANDCELGTCIATDDAFVCFADGDARAPGDPCQQPNDCASGAACLPATSTGECDDASSCCTSLCDLAAIDPSAACLPGQSCTPWYDPNTVMPPLDAIGVCMVVP